MTGSKERRTALAIAIATVITLVMGWIGIGGEGSANPLVFYGTAGFASIVWVLAIGAILEIWH